MLFTGLLWFVLMFTPLVILQRLLHSEIQAVLLILTRNRQLTIGLFSMLFFPGVFLHELSHFLMAKLLGVPTRDFSFVPQTLPDGRLRMGYVETVRTDVLRDSLIGLAPLVSGTLFVAYAGFYRLQIGALSGLLADGRMDLLWAGLRSLPLVNDFLLWFYLAFTVSSTMLPSESDRHAWFPLGLWVIVLFALALFAGAGPWLVENLAPLVNDLLGAVSALFGISVVLHVVLFAPILVFHRVLVRITGVDVK